MDAYETSLFNAIAISLGCIGTLIVINVILLVGFNRRFFKRKEDRYITEIRVLKQERTRIAHDLHDGINSSLSGLKMEMELSGHHNYADQLKLVNNRLEKIIENVLPPDMENENFDIYMGQYLATCSKIYGWPIVFTCKIRSALPASMKMNLYLMLEEIVHNTMKHAQASKMYITIRETRQRLELITEDNGTGFNFMEKNKKGLGLTSLKDRAIILGGELYCHSSPGKGTCYMLKIPIQKWNGSLSS
ncbi:MAG: hypothetical protein H0V30_06010 [Chitinophagaceae bacterium]|nr:hypothetical protein [Chitinophagaceae bacterium]